MLITVDFQSINERLYQTIIDYSIKNNLSESYTGKIIKVLNSFVKYANKNGFETPLYSKDDFKVLRQASDEIYLTNQELENIFSLDLSSMPKGYSLARDLFLIGAYTGMRLSDYNKLKSTDIEENSDGKVFSILTTKTKRHIKIPINAIVEEIINRNNGIPKRIPEQNLNKYIKEIGRLAGITQTIKVIKQNFGKDESYTCPKYQRISSHTARRSFCTNAYLAGVDILVIMSMSGHTTQKNFLKYIKVSQKEQIQRYQETEYFNSLKPTK